VSYAQRQAPCPDTDPEATCLTSCWPLPALAVDGLRFVEVSRKGIACKKLEGVPVGARSVRQARLASAAL
jgi:hypothetical protein